MGEVGGQEANPASIPPQWLFLHTYFKFNDLIAKAREMGHRVDTASSSLHPSPNSPYPKMEITPFW